MDLKKNKIKKKLDIRAMSPCLDYKPASLNHDLENASHYFQLSMFECFQPSQKKKS